MRLLHTSDWHLGQTFFSHDRCFEHQCFLDWLASTLAAENVDALLIAGDVFDNANPSAASQRQLYQFLQQVRSLPRPPQVVMIAGNHDSPGRIEAPSPLLELFATSAIGHSRDGSGQLDLERLVLPITSRDGRERAWCLAVPFLRPGDVPRVEGNADPYMAGIARLYAQALDLARQKRADKEAIIALGHCHMVKGQVTEDSERRIVIGGAEALPAGMFDPDLAYVALGHLHLAQIVAGEERLRYCGSPLPLSFAEISYPHQVLCLDLLGGELLSVRSLAVPRAVDLLRLPAQPGTLEEALAAIQALNLPDRPLERQPYLEVRLRLTQPEPEARPRIEAALADKPVRLARIDARSAAQNRSGDDFHSLDDLSRLEPETVFRQLCQRRIEGAPPPELLAAFQELAQWLDAV